MERDRLEVERDVEIIKVPDAVQKLSKQKVARVTEEKMEM